MATAALFFQRFYMRRSFKDYKYYASEDQLALVSFLCSPLTTLSNNNANGVHGPLSSI